MMVPLERPIRLAGKILKWGNSFGVRLSKPEIESNGLHEGDEIIVEVVVRPGQKIDLSHIKSFNLGGDLSVNHDKYEWA